MHQFGTCENGNEWGALGFGLAPSGGTGIGSVITQHVGTHLLLQPIAGGKAAVSKNSDQAQRLARTQVIVFS